MPRIPVQNLPSVATRPLDPPTIKLNTQGAFGDQLAGGLDQLNRGVQQTSNALLETYKKAKAEADTTAVTEALAQFSDLTNRTVYDSKNGFLAQQGKNALSRSAQTFQELEQQAEKMGAALANDDQRRVFKLRVAGDIQQAFRQIEGHTAGQAKIVERDAFEGRNKAALDRIALAPEELDQQGEQMRGHLLAWAQMQGMDAPARAELISRWDQSATSTALEALLRKKDTAGARALFSARRDSLGTAAPRFEAALREAGVAEEAESVVAGMADKFTAANGRLDGDAVLAQVEAFGGPVEVKERVRQLAQHRVALADRRWEKAAKDEFNRASSAYEQRHSLADIDPATVAWLKDPENGAVGYWQALEDRARRDADYWRARREGRQVSETPDQRSAQFYLEKDMTDHPENYLGEAMTGQEFNALASRLSPQGFKEVTRRFNAMRQAAGKVDPSAPIPRSIDDLVLKAGREAGVFPKKSTREIQLGKPETWTGDAAQTPAGNTAADVYFGIRQRLQDRLTDYKQANGKPPPQDQVEQWLAGELSQVEVTKPGLIWDSKVPTLAADARQAGKPALPVIPEKDRARATAALQRAGLDVTDEAVRELLARETRPRGAGPSGPAPALPPSRRLGPLAPVPGPAAPPVAPSLNVSAPGLGPVPDRRTFTPR